MFVCQFCSFRSRQLRDLKSHIRDTHSSDINFKLTCGIDGCTRTCGSYTAWCSHIKRHHPTVQSIKRSRDAEDPLMDDDCGQEPVGGDFDSSPDDCDNTLHTPDLQHHSALFLLNLKEECQVTQRTVNFVVEGTSNTVERILETCQKSAADALAKAGINAAEISGFAEAFSGDHVSPFCGLKTEYLQSKYTREKLNLVEPESVELGTELVLTRSRSKRRLVEKKITFQYVPILKTLEALLQNKDVFEQVCSSHARHDGALGDFCDGSFFQSHPLFSCDSQALQIVAYYDELEVCNPLGSKRKIHKLGLFYYTLGNMEPKYRSKLHTIQLIAIVKIHHLVRYGFAKVLEPFIRDLHILAGDDGYTFHVNGQSTPLQGTLLAFLADTLAAHQIGGFKVGISFALRKCRTCMASRDDYRLKFRHEEFQERNPASHDWHCQLLEGALAAEDSTTYGVVSKSPLNDIRYFHVAGPQLPQDLMHVLLEGVVPHEVKMLLNQLIEDGNLTYDTLSQRMERFSYKYSESSDKPTPVDQSALTSSDRKLNQSATQMWLLLRLLPLMIGDLVAEDNQYWQCFLMLHEIVSLCLAQVSSPSSTSYLAVLIEEHHKKFVTCYSTAEVTPKIHYMIHFPDLILKMGPLVRAWCMRMEAKHKYFKRLARMGSFKNICYSLAIRHQRRMCAALNSPNFLHTDLECGPGKNPSTLAEEVEHVKSAIQGTFSEVSPLTAVSRPRWVKQDGIEYRIGGFVIVSCKDDIPQFAVIKGTVVLLNRLFLEVEMYNTVGLCGHLQAYEVVRNPQAVHVVPSTSLVDPFVLHVHELCGTQYIVLKGHVC